MLDNWLKELILWNGAHNLMAAEEIANLEEHCADSLSLAPFLEEAARAWPEADGPPLQEVLPNKNRLAIPPAPRAPGGSLHIVDIGSGGSHPSPPGGNKNRLAIPPAPRDPGGSLHIVDIGSGGGFPVIPLAFWAKKQQKDWRFTATDVSDKKIAFLKWSRSKFALPMDVVKVDKRFCVQGPCIITSRAFSEVRGILRWSRAHAPFAQTWLLLKGARAEAELAAAGVSLYELFPNPRGVIVRFGANRG